MCIRDRLNGSAAKYAETKPINAGKYDVKVTAKINNVGGFTGAKELKAAFEIKPLSINCLLYTSRCV